MRIAVCDDEALFAQSFRTKIRDGFRKTIKREVMVDVFNDANTLLYKMRNVLYDVVFMDIEMPGIDGLEAAVWLKKNNSHILVVFTTNRDDLVFDALRIKPLGFLRKSHLAQELDSMVRYISENVDLTEVKISVKCKEGIVNLSLTDVLYLENVGNSIFFVTNDQKYETRDSLYKKEKEFEQYGFLRSHASFVVNLNHVYQIKGKEAILDNGFVVPVSRNKQKEMKDKFLEKQVFNNE